MKFERPPFDAVALGLLVLALAIRLIVVLGPFAAAPIESDQESYLTAGQQLWRFGIYPHELVPDFDQTTEITAIGPGYPVFVALFVPQSVPSMDFFEYQVRLVAGPLRTLEMLRAEIVVMRIVQALIDTGTALLVYWITGGLFGRGAGRIALLVQALDLRYAFQAGYILTETLFIFLMAGALWLYLRGIGGVSSARALDVRRAQTSEESSTGSARSEGGKLHGWNFVAAGLVLGVAALVRPTALLFPVGLAVHAVIVDVKRGLRRGVILLAAFVLAVTPYIVRTSLVVGSFVPISTTGASHLWLATEEEGQDLGAAGFEEERTESIGMPEPTVGDFGTDVYVESAGDNISDQGLGWLERIARDTLASLLQPYGTVFLIPRTDLGVRDLLVSALRGERSLIEVLQAPAFGRRLWMYALHFWGLIFGGAGLALTLWERRIESWALAGWIAYTVLLSAFLLVEPRYLFPMSFALTALAAYASQRGWGWISARRGEA